MTFWELLPFFIAPFYFLSCAIVVTYRTPYKKQPVWFRDATDTTWGMIIVFIASAVLIAGLFCAVSPDNYWYTGVWS